MADTPGVQLLLVSIGLFLSSIWIAWPFIAQGREIASREQTEDWALLQLKIVRRFYPELHDLTYHEIIERYDIDALYNNLGQRELRRLTRL